MLVILIKIIPRKELKLITIGIISLIAGLTYDTFTTVAFNLFSFSFFVEYDGEIINTFYALSSILIIIGSVMFLLTTENENKQK